MLRSLDAGAGGFLLKSASPREIIGAVRSVAGGDAVLSPRSTRQLLDHVSRLDGGEELRKALNEVATLSVRERDVAMAVGRGRSYDTKDDYNVTVPNEWFSVGTAYSPAESITANVAISVPAAEIAGGSWSVSNMDGDGVFIAAVPAE